jgi:hypothetical protein
MIKVFIGLMAFSASMIASIDSSLAAQNCVTQDVGSAYVVGPVVEAKRFNQYCNLKLDPKKTAVRVILGSISPITIQDLSAKGIDLGIVNGHECDIEGMPSLYSVANLVIKIRSTCPSASGPKVYESLFIQRNEQMTPGSNVTAKNDKELKASKQSQDSAAFNPLSDANESNLDTKNRD